MIYDTPIKAENYLVTRKTIYLPHYTRGRHNDFSDIMASSKVFFDGTAVFSMHFKSVFERASRITNIRSGRTSVSFAKVLVDNMMLVFNISWTIMDIILNKQITEFFCFVFVIKVQFYFSVVICSFNIPVDNSS